MRAIHAAGAGLETLLDPDADLWRRASHEVVKLIGTPAGLQPTAAIRVAWTGRRIGAVDRVRVAAAHDGRVLAFRLEWEDGSENRELGDTTAFPDAAAVALPAADGAPLATMGGPGRAVNAWYWRADEEGGARQVVAEGLGTSRTLDRGTVRALGVWKDGRWRVVLARALRVRSSEPLVQLAPGGSSRFGVAVWDGAHGERAGIKAFSGDWRELRLEPAARR